MRLDHLLLQGKRKERHVYGASTNRFFFLSLFCLKTERKGVGDLAQLARASALQAEGQGFKSPNLHKIFDIR